MIDADVCIELEDMGHEPIEKIGVVKLYHEPLTCRTCPGMNMDNGILSSSFSQDISTRLVFTPDFNDTGCILVLYRLSVPIPLVHVQTLQFQLGSSLDN